MQLPRISYDASAAHSAAFWLRTTQDIFLYLYQTYGRIIPINLQEICNGPLETEFV